jgi:hypothetical protein
MIVSKKPKGGSSTTFLKQKAPFEKTCGKMRDTSQRMEGMTEEPFLIMEGPGISQR